MNPHHIFGWGRFGVDFFNLILEKEGVFLGNEQKKWYLHGVMREMIPHSKKEKMPSLAPHFNFTRPIILIDMDGVLVDYDKRAAELRQIGYDGKVFEHPTGFWDMEAIPHAIEAYHQLNQHFEVYICSTPAWETPEVWMEKRRWVEKHLGEAAHKRLILTHNKGLVRGDYLIDDRDANGVGDFVQNGGEWIQFGSAEFPDWAAVLPWFQSKLGVADKSE